MKKHNLGKNLTAMMLAWAMLIMPLAAFGQTRISMPKNKYKIQDDVRIGREASAEVERQMPILNDYEATRYVQDVGRRLVNAIPSQFQHPEFQYTFQVVNARDINAFALPGGPMYVNRGMIEAARSEGEMAGVIAHEIAHVALRHGTAQATEQGKIKNQLGTIGLILGGAILGGEQGAQLGMLGAQAWMTKYSRNYETQADILGAQIMAAAGYDPRDLANMFRTIEQQSGGQRAPEWLSSHPNPGNRYNTINREAEMLRVSRNAVQDTREFQRVQNKLARMPRAQTMEEIARASQNGRGQGQGQGGQNPMGNGRYSSRIAYPSSRMRTYSSGNWIQMNVPDNWREFPTQDSVWFAPEGAYGNEGITHGAMIGVAQARSNNLEQATEDYINGLLQAQGNNYLRQAANYTRTSLGGRNAYATTLAGRSPLTNRNEVVNIITTQLRNGGLFYLVMVAPENESSSYNAAFRNILRSIRLGD
ncbi:MAG: M48 family metallopeptidase [Acidobacteria bacterium]|nr:M48 family metallopeptidase [Acidobacteriota bacterium]MCA1638284.1 M48 family metallopeptidase [Acidobacteriota bacterium]